MFRYFFVCCIALASFFPLSSFAVTIIPDETIDIKNDIIMLNEEIDQKAADKVVFRIHELQSVNKSKPIYMLLDSPGGEVVEGARIIDSMAASSRPVYTVVVGQAASMAAIIHSYGVRRYISPNGILMHHLIAGGISGDIVKMKSRIQMIQKLSDRYVSHIAAMGTMSEKELFDKMSQEWWMNSEEALERKFVDDIVVCTAFVVPKDEEKKKDDPFPWFPFPKK